MSGYPYNLDELIRFRTTETSRIELKATWSEPIKEALTRTICAFANDFLNQNGGYVILGIETDDHGCPVLPPKGLEGLNLDRLQREIRGQCKRIDPEYQPLMFPEAYQGKSIMVVMAVAGDNRPYRAPKTRGSGERAYYVRLGSETVDAQGELQRQLLEQTAKIPFDDRRNLHARLEDISPTLVRRFLADVHSDLGRPGAVVDDKDLYCTLRLVVPINSHLAPKNISLLFFHEDPSRFFPGAKIEIVQFADDAGGNSLDERQVRGPLSEQIRQALDYLNSMGDVLVRKIPGRAEANRTVAYPYEAMEEAVVNAVYHRSYEHSEEPTKIYLYPDRMEVISYPGPVQGIREEHFAVEAHVPPVPARNRRIGEFLKELRLAERRGTGIPKIRRKMEENGSPAPRFDFDEDRTYFRVTLPVHPRYQIIHALRESAHLWAIGERSNALKHLQRVFEQRPGSGTITGQIIEYAIDSDDFALAQNAFDRFQAEPVKTEAPIPYLRYAKVLIDRKETAEALKILELAPAGQEDSSEDLLETAILRKKARDYREAHRIFTRIYPARMDDPKVVHEFAQTKIRLAQEIPLKKDIQTKRRLNQEAVELLRRAIQLSTDVTREAWCWFDLAGTLAWLGEPATEVEAAYQRAIRLKSEVKQFQEKYVEWKHREDARK